MAGYLGNIPTAVPLSSADLADGIITTAKIADGNITSTKILDGTIVNADINASAGIDATKLSGVTSDFVLLATTTASSSASVSFDGYFSSTYTNYQVIFSDVYPASNSSLLIRFRRSNADVTASSYEFASRRTYKAFGASDASDGRYNYNSSSIDVLTNSSPNSATRTTSGLLTIYNPLSTSSYKKINGHAVGASDDAGGTNSLWNVSFGCQLYDNANALSGITFL